MPSVKAESINARIRRFSRNALRGRWNRAISAAVFIIASEFLCGTVVSLFDTAGSNTAFYMSLGIGAILQLFLGVLVTGAKGFYLSMAKGNEPARSALFRPFSVQPDRFFIVELIKLAVSIVIYSPSLYAIFRMTRNPDVLFIVFLVWTVIGTLLLITFRIQISLAPFLLCENDELGAIESISKSIQLMNGKKMKMFTCFLPFIGYILLTFCSLGVGIIWLVPYMLTTTAEFYRFAIGEIE